MKNIYWRDVVADKLSVQLENNQYFVEKAVVDSNDELVDFEKVSVFWHGTETHAAQRALDSLIEWKERVKQETIDRVVAKVMGPSLPRDEKLKQSYLDWESDK